VASTLLTGCGSSPAPKSEEPVAAKPAEPAVAPELQSAADALLGTEAKVLASGDLAKNGKQQVLVANVVPKTPKDNITGTIVTRAVIAQNENGQWSEVFSRRRTFEECQRLSGHDADRAGERLAAAIRTRSTKGLTLYLTPVKGMDDKHVLPIAVRWNPKTQRYQSLDRTYEHFLSESPSLSNTRSQLK